MDADLLLTGGLVVDGAGTPPRLADVAVTAGRIVALGDLAATPAGERIDATGLVVAPGFIDLHAHSDLTLFSDGGARSAVAQGITTQVVGNCGIGPFPAPATRAGEVRAAAALIDLDPAVPLDWVSAAGYRAALAAAGTAIHVAPLCGHLALRVAVAGPRAGPLDATERLRLGELADEALAEGAVGLSTGLMYPPARDADALELDVLGRVAARHGRVFAMHLRDYAGGLLDAVDEAIGVARRTGCRLQLSHLAVAGRRNHGSVARALERVDDARAAGLDIGVDIYPYLAGSANLSQLLPGWAQAGGPDAIVARLADPAVRQRVADEWRATLHLGWDEVRVSLVDEELREAVLGRTIGEAADVLGCSPDEAAMTLIARTRDHVQMVAFGRSEADLHAVLRHPAACIGSDGLALDPDGPTGVGHPHPRSYGCYPRLLGRVVREDGLLTLEDAIRMSTSAPAARLGLSDRGRLAPGLAADLVVFDAATVLDRATFEEPARFPEGIAHVVVAGVPVIRDGRQLPGVRPGRVLTLD
ncbi:MAG: D-aminoacylase [Chloroflexi bacterium]|nr:D-aminoacylase [Chloroflexota bacterium]